MQNVVIKISSTIESDGDCETIEFTTVGKMMVKDNVCHITYEENDGSGNSNGMIKVEGQTVVIRRSGEAASKMTITAGKRFVGHYDMGSMGMMVGVTGRRVDAIITETTADIFLEYAIDINASPISVNKVKITANPT